MSQIQSRNTVDQNEIDLIDLVRIFWSRRILIVGGTLLATVAAVIISFLLPSVYEISMIFEPAKIAGEPIAPESVRESIVGEVYDYRIRQELNIPFGEYPKIRATIPKGTGIIKVAIESKTPVMAKDILLKMLSHIEDEYDQRLEYERSKIRNEIKWTKIKNEAIIEKLKLAKSQIDVTNKKITVLENNKLKAMSTSSEGAMNVLLYSNEIQNQQIYINGLQEKFKNLEEESNGADIRIDNLQLQLARLKGMNILKPVTVSEAPVKPKRTLIVVMVFISSIILLAMVSFVLNYIETKKL